jgi:hypothetical protein
MNPTKEDHMPKEIKKEVDEDTHLRRLFSFYLKQSEEELEIKIPNKDRSEMVSDLVTDFGAAIEAVVTCAVDALLAQILDDEEGEEEGEDEEDEEDEEGGDDDVVDAEFEDEETADAA